VFGAPIGGFMGITVFRNGSLARERVRDELGLDWRGFSAALRASRPGNGGAIMLPWFESEITPAVLTPGVRTFGVPAGDGPARVRAVVEGQMIAMARHSKWMGVTVDTIHATGGASANRDLLQVMADVFGAEVFQFEVGNSASLGAALRAFHADGADQGHAVPWEDVVRGFAEQRSARYTRRARPTRWPAGRIRSRGSSDFVSGSPDGAARWDVCRGPALRGRRSGGRAGDPEFGDATASALTVTAARCGRCRLRRHAAAHDAKSLPHCAA
jgi:hypothetical protein